MLQRTNMKFRGSLFWGLVPGARFNPHPRVKEEANSEKLCSDTLVLLECLERVASIESTDRIKQLSSPTGLLGPSSLLHPSTCSCTQPCLSHNKRRCSGQRDEFGFPGGRQTRISGSAMVHTVCSLKRSKHIYFWHKTDGFLRLHVSRARMSSLTTTFTSATPKIQHLSSFL